jgi:hypothetical protein
MTEEKKKKKGLVVGFFFFFSNLLEYFCLIEQIYNCFCLFIGLKEDIVLIKNLERKNIVNYVII